MPNKHLGLTRMGWIWIIGSVGQMVTLLNWSWYEYLFGTQMTMFFLFLRFLGSWALRIAGLWAGIQLLKFSNKARRMIIFISALSIVTTYWKHPYEALYRQSLWMQDHFGMYGIKVSEYTSTLVIMACAWDIVFFGFVIYYLTRTHVKSMCT